MERRAANMRNRGYVHPRDYNRMSEGEKRDLNEDRRDRSSSANRHNRIERVESKIKERDNDRSTDKIKHIEDKLRERKQAQSAPGVSEIS